MGDLGKIIVATGFEKLLKVQYLTQSGHTACQLSSQFNKKIGCFCKAIFFNFIFKNNPTYCWTGKLSCKPVTPLSLNSSMVGPKLHWVSRWTNSHNAKSVVRFKGLFRPAVNLLGPATAALQSTALFAATCERALTELHVDRKYVDLFRVSNVVEPPHIPLW